MDNIKRSVDCLLRYLRSLPIFEMPMAAVLQVYNVLFHI